MEALQSAMLDPKLRIELRLLARGIQDARLTTAACEGRIELLTAHCARILAAEAARAASSHRAVPFEVMRGLTESDLDPSISRAAIDQFLSIALKKPQSALQRLEERRRVSARSSATEPHEILESFTQLVLPDLDTVLSCRLENFPPAVVEFDKAAMFLDTLGFRAWSDFHDATFACKCVEIASRLALSSRIKRELKLILQQLPHGTDGLRSERATAPLQRLHKSMQRHHVASAERCLAQLRATATAGLLPLLVDAEEAFGRYLGERLFVRAYALARSRKWASARRTLLQTRELALPYELRGRVSSALDGIDALTDGRMAVRIFFFWGGGGGG